MIGLVLLSAPTATTHPEPTYTDGWRRAAAPVLEGTVSFTLALAQTANADVRAAAIAVSDPSSPRYGRFLSRDALANISSKNTRAVAEFQQQYMSSRDLKTFFRKCRGS